MEWSATRVANDNHPAVRVLWLSSLVVRLPHRAQFQEYLPGLGRAAIGKFG